MTTGLWTPQKQEAEAIEAFDAFSPVWVSQEKLGEGDRAALYALSIICPYCKKSHRVEVWGTTADSRWEIEDEYLASIRTWLNQCYEQEHKRPPTEAEAKQIGRAIEDFRQYKLRRSQSSNGRLYY